MHDVEMELTDLEWEVINQALSAPLRDYLIENIRSVTTAAMPEDEILNAWTSVQAKFSETW
jgi:hypothetical protein